MFGRRPRIEMPDDVVVVTVATPDFWPHLQALTLSLQLSHHVRKYCIDLGLTLSQQRWLWSHGMKTRLPSGPLPMPDSVRRHVIWNKPAFISQGAMCAPNVIWIDADAIVMGSLLPIYELLQSRPIFTPDNITRHRRPQDWQHLVRNKSELYKMLPVPQRATDAQCINAGVCAWQFPRDEALFDSYLWLVEAAAKDKPIRNAIRCWDQGALLWALEKHQRLDCVVDHIRWNDSVTADRCADLGDIAGRIHNSGNPSVIYHFAGAEKTLNNPLEWITDPIAPSFVLV